jgi:hypothetical protein
MSVALSEPVDAMSGGLESVRGMLGSLDDREIVQALRVWGSNIGWVGATCGFRVPSWVMLRFDTRW